MGARREGEGSERRIRCGELFIVSSGPILQKILEKPDAAEVYEIQ
jgi:hypothetical protein